VTVEFASAALTASVLAGRSMDEEHRFLRRHRRRRHSGSEDLTCLHCCRSRLHIALAKKMRREFRRTLREWDAQWFGKCRRAA